MTLNHSSYKITKIKQSVQLILSSEISFNFSNKMPFRTVSGNPEILKITVDFIGNRFHS